MVIWVKEHTHGLQDPGLEDSTVAMINVSTSSAGVLMFPLVGAYVVCQNLV